VASKRRIEVLEKDLQLAEAAYEERFTVALRSCIGGKWGLFGANDAAHEAHFGSKNPLYSKDAGELLERGDEIAELRSRLGHIEPFNLHERFLAYRKMATGANAVGEPRLAQQLLDEIVASPLNRKKTLRRLYKDFDEWLVQRFDQWDPQGLIIGGNPGREYGPEVSRINPLLRTVESVDELASKMRDVFAEMFDPESAGPVENYVAIAREVLTEWHKRLAALDR
jgi:hypothetical protein